MNWCVTVTFLTRQKIRIEKNSQVASWIPVVAKNPNETPENVYILQLKQTNKDIILFLKEFSFNLNGFSIWISFFF